MTYNKLKKGEVFMGYYGNAGNYNCCYGGYGHGYAGSYGGGYGGYGNDYGGSYCMDYGKNNSSPFVLIVVLFILLIIVGATFVDKEY